MSVRLDADGEDYVCTGSMPGATDAFTVTLWAYISVDRGTNSTIFCLDANDTDSYVLLMTDPGGVDMKLFCESIGGTQQALTGPVMSVGAWYRFGVVRSGSNLSLYYGTESGALSGVGPGAVANLNSLQNLIIGDSGSFGGLWWNGRIANFKRWTSTVSAEWATTDGYTQPASTDTIRVSAISPSTGEFTLTSSGSNGSQRWVRIRFG